MTKRAFTGSLCYFYLLLATCISMDSDDFPHIVSAQKKADATVAIQKLLYLPRLVDLAHAKIAALEH